MGWQITFGGTRRQLTNDELNDLFVTRWEGGTVVDLDDLAPDVFDGLADDTTTWWGVYKNPCGSGARMYAVACAAAQHAAVDSPAQPTNMRETKLLLEMFEPTQDIEDRPTVNGFPQMPLEPENGSSSGPQDVSGGDPPKSELKL